MFEGTTGSMMCFFTCARSSSVEILSSCCVETTTASMRLGLPSTYSTLTWLLPSGRRKSSRLARRTSLNCCTSLCAIMIGSGINSLVSSQAIAEHQALVARAARVHAHGDIGRLALDGVENPAGLAVEAHGGIGVADVVNHAAHQARHVHIGIRL